MNSPARREELLRSLEKEWPVDLRAEIQKEIRASGRKAVVLDDDPTGTQTVHGIPVLTEWTEGALRPEFLNDLPAFYILTNSRSLSVSDACAMNEEIGRNLVKTARQTNRPFVVVSRSDSTLRGHFPCEVDALSGALGGGFDGWIINPFFLEGGRYTIGDIHYVDEGGRLIPAGETEFARDKVFGYRSSNLREWVEEKTGGRIASGAVLSLSIDDMRRGGPERVAGFLQGMTGGCMCVVNAASYRDLEVLVRGLLQAEAGGKRFLYRTAASFVQVRAGVSPRPLLSRKDLNLPSLGGGLVIVGSHVARSTAQLQGLLALEGVLAVEMSVEALLKTNQGHAEIERVAQEAEAALQEGGDVVIYTSRRLLTVEDAEGSLSIGRRVSDALVAALLRISVRPRYLIAKGGITASDVATKGLGVRRAMVLGQILAGVPVWQLGPESRYPGMPYVVFPGNVGGPEALSGVVKGLREQVPPEGSIEPGAPCESRRT